MAEMGSLPVLGTTPRIQSLLVKPASAVCNLDCEYCFYLDRNADPYRDLPGRRMSDEVLERMTDQFMFYSYPNSVFAWQGGEPTLAGLEFFERAVELQQRYGRPGQVVSNALQTNAIVINEDWCPLLRDYSFLLGVSLDGPQEVHDRYRLNRGRQGTWRRVMDVVEILRKHKVDFNILCVVNQANVGQPRKLYEWFKREGFDFVQYIPLAEFDKDGKALPFALQPEQWGNFLVETFECWWPDRRTMHLRFFDNVVEALVGERPGNCTMHTTCDSYVVIEYNGDVYTCDFFVEQPWKIGNIMIDSFPEVARKARRVDFARTKTLPRAECASCEFEFICHGGCPKMRYSPHHQFEDLDYFCRAYKMIYARALPPLRREAERIRKEMADAGRVCSVGPMG